MTKSLAAPGSDVGQWPVCAVLLATYNGSNFLSAQIDSILAQQEVRTIIHVRDDGSSDATREILSAYASKFPEQIRILPTASRRFGAACGNFFSILHSVVLDDFHYIAFADQDDIWLPRKLSRAIACLKEEKADGYASNLTAFSEHDGSEWTIRKATKQRRFDHLFQSASAGCTYVMSWRAARLVAERIGPVEASDWQGMSHDWLCYAICRSFGMKWLIDDWSGMRYRQHAHNQFGAMPGWSGTVARFKLLSEGWYRATFLKNRRFLNPDNVAEQEICDHVESLLWRDRLWLSLRVFEFRRESKHRLALLAAILTGRF